MKIVIIKRSFDECTSSGFLSVPELENRYVAGYASWSRGNKYFHVEERLIKTHDCSAFKKGCRAKWYGFETVRGKMGVLGGNGPWALYKCKHGLWRMGVVQEIILSWAINPKRSKLKIKT